MFDEGFDLPLCVAIYVCVTWDWVKRFWFVWFVLWLWVLIRVDFTKSEVDRNGGFEAVVSIDCKQNFNILNKNIYFIGLDKINEEAVGDYWWKVTG